MEKSDFKKNIGYVGLAVLLMFLNIKFQDLPVTYVIGAVFGIIAAIWFRKNHNQKNILVGLIIMIAGGVISFVLSNFALVYNKALIEKTTEFLQIIASGNVNEDSILPIVNSFFELIKSGSSSIIASSVIGIVGQVVASFGIKKVSAGVKDVSQSEEANEKIGKAANAQFVSRTIASIISIIMVVIALNAFGNLKFIVTDGEFNVENLSSLANFAIVGFLSLPYLVCQIIYIVNVVKVVLAIFKTQDSGEATTIETEVKYE